jgi:hypothetical protein
MKLRDKDVPAFARWLEEHGSKVLPTCSPRELIRFMAGNTVCVISSDGAKGKAIFNKPAAAGALAAFQGGMAWGVDRLAPRISTTRSLYEQISERDGGICFFCRLPIYPGEGSIKHLVAVADGGRHTPANMFVAHKPCNKEAGRLAAAQKVQIAITAAVRMALAGTGPAALRRVA